MHQPDAHLEAILDFTPIPYLTQSTLCQFYFQNIAQADPHVSILPAAILIQAIIVAWLDSWYSVQMVLCIQLTWLP